MEKWSLESCLVANAYERQKIVINLQIETTNFEFTQKLVDMMSTIISIINNEEIEYERIK